MKELPHTQFRVLRIAARMEDWTFSPLKPGKDSASHAMRGALVKKGFMRQNDDGSHTLTGAGFGAMLAYQDAHPETKGMC